MLAVLVCWLGYTTFVYGLNHLRGGCRSFRGVAWPTTGPLPADPCTGSNAVSAGIGGATQLAGQAASGVGSLLSPQAGSQAGTAQRMAKREAGGYGQGSQLAVR